MRSIRRGVYSWQEQNQEKFKIFFFVARTWRAVYGIARRVIIVLSTYWIEILSMLGSAIYATVQPTSETVFERGNLQWPCQ